MRGVRSDRSKHFYIEQKLREMGLPGTREEARRILLARRYFQRNPKVNPLDLSRPTHELSFLEFKSAFADQAIAAVDTTSVNRIDLMLRGWYERDIIDAVLADKKCVSIEGLEMIRFRVDQMQAVKQYCRRHGIVLD